MVFNYKKHFLLTLVLILMMATFLVIRLDWKSSHRKFTFAMLDVGQGDALFIESPTGTQVLVDAGPPGKIMGELLRVMPPYDRSLDATVISNPDQDHIGGFESVLKSYRVGLVLEPGATSDSKTYQILQEQIRNKKIPDVLARRGMKLDLGGGARLEILFPDRDVSDWETNDGSLVARVVYGETKIMLMGDAPTKTEKIILKENPGELLESNVLKLGHHGSRTSSSREFLETVSPVYALISDGKKNKYGHPHQEILDLLDELGVKTLRTDLLGTIFLRSDGQKEGFKFLK